MTNKLLQFFTLITFFYGLQAQEITLDKMFSGAYSQKRISGIKSLNDGENYAVIENDGIVKYSYLTTNKVGTIVEGNYQDYIFSDDESKVLLQVDNVSVYRHSFLGKYQIKDLKTGEDGQLNNGNWVQEPKFSPDGSKVAFVSNNNLFYQDLKSGQIKQITNDGKKNEIINGLADWVYEEEFSHADFYQWDKSGDAIVFIKFNEKDVQEVNIPIYENNLYPQLLTYKYPKAGTDNSIVTANIYQLSTDKTIKLDIDKYENYYIPNLYQTNYKDEIILITSNRHQNNVDLLKINTKTAQVQKLFTEKDAAWIDTDNLTIDFLDDNSFFWASERDGNRHLYWYNSNGTLKKQVTKGNWEVLSYYGYNPKTKEVFLQTTEGGSINKVISKMNINSGKSNIISDREGNNSASFNKTFNYFINTSSTSNVPTKYVLYNIQGKQIRELQNNTALLQVLKKDNFQTKEFFTIPNNVGDQMNAYMIKPQNFDPSKKYPVFMYQYSGPGSQSVENAWGGYDLWFNTFAKKGYIVVCVDGRGTGRRGVKYKKVIYKNLGKYEIEDQIAAAQWLGKQAYIDKSRIGIFGWSFGGYISSLALTKGADVFKLGIAVAPVTNWRYYDTIYTERFLQTPQENPSGYDDNSPTSYAELMKGKFLLIHGTADDNVHFQNSMEFSEGLIQNKKQFDFMAYPDKNHGIYGGNTSYQLYQKMTNYILQNL